MLISARTHYACLAMLELAIRSDQPAPLAVREITDRHNIPGPFLVQILRPLRAAGWIQSIRGSQGGYRLLVDPSQITLLDIAEVMGCQESSGRPATESATTSLDAAIQGVWSEASEASRRVLSRVRLSDLAERCQQSDEVMFYI